MKKYIVCVAAFFMLAVMANAQAEKKPAKMSSKPATSKTSVASKTSTSTNVTPMSTNTAKPATTSTAIKRKHPHKKTTPAKKTESK